MELLAQGPVRRQQKLNRGQVRCSVRCMSFRLPLPTPRVYSGCHCREQLFTLMCASYRALSVHHEKRAGWCREHLQPCGRCPLISS